MRKVLKYLTPALLGIFAFAVVASAQLVPPPTIETPPSQERLTFTQTVVLLINYALYIVGAIALIMLIYGGFQYIISGGNEEAVEKAKKIITYAVIGLIVVIISWVIVYAVIGEIFGVEVAEVPKKE